MQSRSHTRLALPVAAIVALGALSVPHSTTPVPRLVGVSNVRLQAEVTTLIAGVADVAVVTPAAASGLAAGGAAATCTYPCTVLDKWLSNLPPNVRDALLPPLYGIAFVVGLVLAPVLLVTSALFGRPYSLRPAAAIAPTPAAARTAATPSPDPSSTPGVAAVAADVSAVEPDGTAVVAPRHNSHSHGRTPVVPRAAAVVADAFTTVAAPEAANPAARPRDRASHSGARGASGPAAAAAKRSAR